DFEAIVIPGGRAPEKMRLHQSMVDLVKEAEAAGLVIAAVCHGPQLLISAGVVKGRTLTCTPSIAIDVQNAGGNYVDQAVVRDGNLITSRNPDDLPMFSKTIIEALEERKARRPQTRA
ncbi:MAG: DJ-1/PfpI family protein, partial [Chloroflexota bacterium]